MTWRFAARVSQGESRDFLHPALYCLDSVSMRWARLPCENAHKGGAIAVVGSTVFVGGGFDPANKQTLATDAVELFTLAA